MSLVPPNLRTFDSLSRGNGLRADGHIHVSSSRGVPFWACSKEARPAFYRACERALS
jgi:hypothetical protein